MTTELNDFDEELESETYLPSASPIANGAKTFPAPSDPATCASCRLDTWLANVSGISRSRIQSMLKEGLVTTRNGSVPASRKVSAGESYTIAIPEPKPTEIRPEDIPQGFVKQAENLGCKALSGLLFRTHLEQLAKQHGNGQSAPAQKLKD